MSYWKKYRGMVGLRPTPTKMVGVNYGAETKICLCVTVNLH